MAWVTANYDRPSTTAKLFDPKTVKLFCGDTEIKTDLVSFEFSG